MAIVFALFLVQCHSDSGSMRMRNSFQADDLCGHCVHHNGHRIHLPLQCFGLARQSFDLSYQDPELDVHCILYRIEYFGECTRCYKNVLFATTCAKQIIVDDTPPMFTRPMFTRPVLTLFRGFLRISRFLRFLHFTKPFNKKVFENFI